MLFKLIFLFVFVTKTASQVCDQQNSVELTNRTYNDVMYGDSEIFVNESGAERGCVCMKQTCARKCCPFGQGYDEDNFSCTNMSLKFDPPIYDGNTLQEGFNTTDELYFFMAKMKCLGEHEDRIFLSSVSEEFYFNTDGTLHVILEDNIPDRIILSADRYCMDNFLYDKNKTKLDALICLKTKEEHYNYALNSGCMLVSCFFIILTVAVYAILPDLRTTIPGMVMIACLSSFFVSFLVMSAMQLSLYMENITNRWCLGMAFIIYYSTLAAFFWLNVMSFDLWRTLRNINVTVHGASAEKRTRFLWYSTYAFGIPTALTILIAALEFSSHRYNRFFPNLRRQGCFLDGMGRLIYFYLPMLLVCASNLVFFILTARKIAEIKKQTQRLHKKDSQRLSLYFKLFLVTGCNWLLEAISAYAPDIDFVWQFTDAYNFLTGVVIFIIFVCKKKILKDLKQRFMSLMGKAPPKPGSAVTASSSFGTSKSHSQETLPMDASPPVKTVTENTA